MPLLALAGGATYGAIYYHYVVTNTAVNGPLYFQYAARSGSASMRAFRRAEIAHLNQKHSSDAIFASLDAHLYRGKQYSAVVDLTFPDSDHNNALGRCRLAFAALVTHPSLAGVVMATVDVYLLDKRTDDAIAHLRRESRPVR